MTAGPEMSGSYDNYVPRGFARRVANRTIFMKDGAIHEEGPSADLFASPKTPELQAFLRSEIK